MQMPTLTRAPAAEPTIDRRKADNAGTPKQAAEDKSFDDVIAQADEATPREDEVTPLADQLTVVVGEAANLVAAPRGHAMTDLRHGFLLGAAKTGEVASDVSPSELPVVDMVVGDDTPIVPDVATRGIAGPFDTDQNALDAADATQPQKAGPEVASTSGKVDVVADDGGEGPFTTQAAAATVERGAGLETLTSEVATREVMQSPVGSGAGDVPMATPRLATDNAAQTQEVVASEVPKVAEPRAVGVSLPAQIRTQEETPLVAQHITGETTVDVSRSDSQTPDVTALSGFGSGALPKAEKAGVSTPNMSPMADVTVGDSVQDVLADRTFEGSKPQASVASDTNQATPKAALAYAHIQTAVDLKAEVVDPSEMVDFRTEGVLGTVTREVAQASNVAQIQRTELPAHIAGQIAEAARQLPDRPVEITLTPEELGRVRLTFQVSETGAMTVVVQADRTETADLMRRNIHTLQQDFAAMGYEGSSFEFQHGGQGDASANNGRGDSSGSTTDQHDLRDADIAATTVQPHRVSLSENARVDIRL
ncbi:flagellar hook-length control protein FliK [Celeribacter marinus]|uniref:flagellar hook-length control protein FliK n=1 Tax=Celeribacter marinus TaxID=1397108 RepID=UPI003F6D4105